MILRARTQLGGPIVLVWDNVRVHLTKYLRAFIEANADWLTRRAAADLCARPEPDRGRVVAGQARPRRPRRHRPGPGHAGVKHRLKQLQYRPDLVDGCLAGTGLSLHGGT